jgi:hypothetical protein
MDCVLEMLLAIAASLDHQRSDHLRVRYRILGWTTRDLSREGYHSTRCQSPGYLDGPPGTCPGRAIYYEMIISSYLISGTSPNPIGLPLCVRNVTDSIKMPAL